MALAGQQQNLTQQQLGQTNQLDILQRLFGASPSSPSQPITQPGSVPVAPTDVIGATNASTNASMNAYNANQANQRSMFGGLAGLGSAAIGLL